MKKGSKKYTEEEKQIRMERFNEWLKDYKERNGIKKDKDLLELLHCANVSHLSAIKSGKRAVPDTMIRAITRIDGTYTEEYLTGKTDIKNYYEELLDQANDKVKEAQLKAQIINNLFLLQGLNTHYEYLYFLFGNGGCYIEDYDGNGMIRFLPDYIEFEGNDKKTKDIQITFEQIEKTYKLLELLFKANLDL